MTSFAPAGRCFCVRRVADMSCPAWVAVHVLLYVALDAVALGMIAHLGGAADPVVMVPASFAWALPVHAMAVAVAVLLLLALRPMGTLRRGCFRLAAAGVFAVPALPAARLLTDDVAIVAVIVGWHLLMGLLVVQPARDRAHDLPAMDAHRF